MICREGKLEGWFKLTVRDTKTKVVTKDLGWFKNLITNAGLDSINTGFPGLVSGSLVVFNSAFVGSGNTTPAYTDTQMTALVAHSGGVNTNPPSSTPTYVPAAGSVPPYWTESYTWAFPAGSATGTLAEVGVGGFSTSTAYSLFSHALIVDGSGNPTTITVLSTEELDVTYQLRLYWNVTTQTGTLTINGVVYATTWLPMYLPGFYGTAGNFAGQITQGIIGSFNSGVGLRAWDGALGTITTLPSGNNANAITIPPTFGTYSPGQYYIDATFSASINELNLPNEIAVLSPPSSPFHQYQIGFTPVIPKTNLYSFSFTCRYGWGRY